MIETLALVAERFQERIESNDFANIHRWLTEQKQSTMEMDDVDARLEEFRHVMSEARERVADWQLSMPPGKAIEKGVASTYGRALVAKDAACEKATPKRYHEWRKQVKYHWNHARLLQRMWPQVMKGYSQELKRVAIALGEHHDLAVLTAKLESAVDEPGDAEEVRLFSELAEELQTQLVAQVLRLSNLLLSGKPKSVGKIARQLLKGNKLAAALVSC